MHAAMNADAATVKELLGSGADFTAQDNDGWTALMWAASPYGSNETVELLLKAGDDPNRKTRSSWTVLMSAVLSGNVDRVKMLIASGADVNFRESTFGETVLMISALHGRADMVTALLKVGADITMESNAGITAPRRAMYNKGEDKDEIVKMLRVAWDAVPWPTKPDEIRLITRKDHSLAPAPSIRPTQTGVRRVDDQLEARGLLWVYNTRLDLAFDILWRMNGQEKIVGSLVARHGAVRAFRYATRLDRFQPRQVDVILRPNPQLAIEALDTWEIWGEELVFKNIPVRRNR